MRFDSRSKAQLKGVDTLNFDPARYRRVFLVPDRPKSGSLTTHDWPLRAMDAMAADSSQRVKDNSPHRDTWVAFHFEKGWRARG